MAGQRACSAQATQAAELDFSEGKVDIPDATITIKTSKLAEPSESYGFEQLKCAVDAQRFEVTRCKAVLIHRDRIAGEFYE